ncbi:hypothetical protein AQF52_3253 [Streptomyces venezuelae]|uniref:hypothetical protein n=1 Tax=Streptomyces gardneri TaxID=66892 RepID=UPI0006BD53F1|nr:hypothetical protein [Streptomyces gardneri]ALO08847.1 hypothetical protein AQF52_3253 [Streptomyces venezuelae]QPK46020.1 hypothetical protein H4W23_16175 [Streptomyces gardneri]WRK37378.1 hypothetical protein U0M97_16255 [Streptomyces venezuelae]CUM40767.1 FIG01128468: hypothetical protein [Streptomyces venezuelae]
MSAAGVALMLGGAGILISAGPAQAAEVSYKTECVPPPISGLPPVQGTTKVLITAPAEAKVGDEVEIVWKTVQAASKNPDVLDLGADTVKPSGVLTVGGAGSGTVAMEGPRKNPPIPKNSPMVLPEMKGKLKLDKAGDITLTPDKYTINVSKPLSTDTKCAPKEAVPVAATIKVTAGGGGTSSGGSSTTTSGGSSTTTSGGSSTTTSGGSSTTTSGGTSTNGGHTGGAAASSSGGTGGSTSTSGGSTSTSGGSSTSSGGATTGGSSTTEGSSTSGSSSASGGSGGSGGGQTDFPGKEVTVAFTCTSPGPPNINSKVTISAKKNGAVYDLTVKTAKGVMNSPAPLPKGALVPSMAVKIGGADSGTVKVTGAPNSTAVAAGAPVSLEDMKGTYKPGATGKSTLSPGALTISVTLGEAKMEIPCQVKGAVNASLELDTSKQAGGASGGSDGGSSTSGSGSASGGGSTSSGGSSGENLAETGAESDGALRALALVAGTVILVGGAVFTFTPWARLRR